MTAAAGSYAVGVLSEVDPGLEIAAYLTAIDDTLTPFEGRFLIHGAPPDIREGSWSSDLIVIAFPDPDGARLWYESEDYRRIAPLRSQHSVSTIALFAGVDGDHRASDILGHSA